MIEINNGKTKRLMGLLAQDDTLALMRAMRTGKWYTAAELSKPTGIPVDEVSTRLQVLAELGIAACQGDAPPSPGAPSAASVPAGTSESNKNAGARYKLLHRRIQVNFDIREIPPGPGYILDVVRFYNHVCNGVLERCREAGGQPAAERLLEAIARVRSALSERERLLVMCVGANIDFSPCLERLEARIMEGELSDADLPWVRAAYLSVLEALLDSLDATLDETLAKLVFRLAVKEPLKEGGDLAARYTLLETVPEEYLRLV